MTAANQNLYRIQAISFSTTVDIVKRSIASVYDNTSSSRYMGLLALVYKPFLTKAIFSTSEKANALSIPVVQGHVHGCLSEETCPDVVRIRENIIMNPR